MSLSRTWTAQLERLAGTHRVVAPDLFGSGDSDKPAGDYSLGSHAATLRDLMDELGIAGATVVGHSLGGGVAIQSAYLFPDRVDAIVLVSSGGLGKGLHPLLRVATLPGSDLVLQLFASGWLHAVGDTALQLWGKLGAADQPRLRTRCGGRFRHWRTSPNGCTAASTSAGHLDIRM